MNGEETPDETTARAHRAAAALLAWYRAMGIDQAVSDNATDWLEKADTAPGLAVKRHLKEQMAGAPAPTTQPRQQAASAQPSMRPTTQPGPAGSKPPPTATPTPRAFPARPPHQSVAAARETARSLESLSALATALASFEGCGLKATAKNTCVYRGAEKSRLLVIGEAPGRDEDIAGKPFVGRAGRLLDKMLAAIGIDETSAHITNVVYWRPPGNRTPTPLETQICRPFLERQVELVEPEIAILLGGSAAKSMLDTKDGIMRLRGRWHELVIGDRTIRAMATLHPAYLLRTPAAKRQAWRDLLAVREVLDKPGS